MTTVDTRIAEGAAHPEPAFVLDLRSHRGLRGPYTAGGQLLRHIVPELTEIEPGVMRPLATAVVAIAPDLAGFVPTRPQTLTDLAEGNERTRFYPVQRTRDLAYLVSELVRVWAQARHPEGVLLRWWELQDADHHRRAAGRDDPPPGGPGTGRHRRRRPPAAGGGRHARSARPAVHRR